MMTKHVVIYSSAVKSILNYAKTLHPKEGVLLSRGKVDKNSIVIEEVVIPPLATHGHGFSSFPLHMLPNDFSIIGTVHSHPSGVLKPSIEDLNHFYGKIMIIAAYPYDSDRQIAIFDRAGNSVEYEVVSYERGTRIVKKGEAILEEKLVIRGAGLKDAETIADFNIKMAEETEGKRIEKDVVLEGVKAVLKDPHKGFYLVAETRNDSAKIVGQLMITFEWSDWRNKNFWWLQSVYVDKNYRNQRVFSHLYERTIEMARQQDVFGLRLYVEKHNKSAKEVYDLLSMTKTSYEVYERTII